MMTRLAGRFTPWASDVVEQSTEIRPAEIGQHSTEQHSMAQHSKALSEAL
jgi:hypothetical protein